MLKGMPSLPSLPVLPTFRLTPTAFAQAQVVFEFMAAFSDFLRCGECPASDGEPLPAVCNLSFPPCRQPADLHLALCLPSQCEPRGVLQCSIRAAGSTAQGQGWEGGISS